MNASSTHSSLSKPSPAWSLRSAAYSEAAQEGFVDTDEGFRRARADAEQAIALDPNSAAGYLALANVQINYDFNWQGAEASLNKAAVLEPGGVPYGWMKIYETLLFAFYNPRTGECFPSHEAIAAKARCAVSTVQRALKWARQNGLILWAHGLVRDGWRVLRTSNRYAFAAFLSIRRIAASIAASNGQKRRGVPTSYKSLTETAAEARAFRFPPAPSTT